MKWPMPIRVKITANTAAKNVDNVLLNVLVDVQVFTVRGAAFKAG
jgi:hypothetical protein